MIRRCRESDFEAIYSIINETARSVFQGVIPPDCWKDPYFSVDELQREIDEGVMFWAYEDRGELVGVMGLQHMLDLALIRNAYVKNDQRNKGVGGLLISSLFCQTSQPLIVGTFAVATWAIRFYEKHGFRLVPDDAMDRLLRGGYWPHITEGEISASVVLADDRWFATYRQPRASELEVPLMQLSVGHKRRFDGGDSVGKTSSAVSRGG